MKSKKTNENNILVTLQKFITLEIQRYTSIPFPNYRHIPGLTPHPISNINGHSYGKKKEIIKRISEKNWFSNNQYLYAIDLFNYKYFWEAHEVLEDLWRLEPPSNLKLFLQGIIQISAAYLKWIQEIYIGMNKLSFKGIKKLHLVKESHRNFCGIDLEKFIEENQNFFNFEYKKNKIPPSIELKKM